MISLIASVVGMFSVISNIHSLALLTSRVIVCLSACLCVGPVRNGDLFEITFSSDNSINSTGFYASYHVINASMMTSSPDRPIAGRCK